MPAHDALLFIDANRYLDLYRIPEGKKLLALLVEQAAHIFVTQQVVNEVQRNKVVAAVDLAGRLKKLKLQTLSLPDHLSGVSASQREEILQQTREIGQKIKKVNRDLKAPALGIVKQVSRSEDEVSIALASIFTKAVPHSAEELQRAKDRKELGNPPGKSTNRLGDQLHWEQILTHFKGKRRLWIISKDGDFGTMYGGRGFLNAFLFNELCEVTPEAESHLFADTAEGIEDFVKATGVAAEQRLTPEEKKEIKKQEQSLPPLGWMSGNSGDALGWLHGRDRAARYSSVYSSDIESYPATSQRRPPSPALFDAMASQVIAPAGVLPVDPNQTGGG
jgi:hypothetical protein